MPARAGPLPPPGDSALPSPATFPDARTGAESVWRDYTRILASQALGMALGLGGAALVTRRLGPRGYGTVALFVSALQLLYVVGIQWTMVAAIRFGREALVLEGTAGRLFWSWSPLVAAAFLVTALVSFSPWVDRYTGLGTSALWLLPLLLLLTTAARGIEYLLQTQGRMTIYAAGRPAGKLFFCLALLATAPAAGGGDAAGVILLMGTALAVQALVGLPFLGLRLFRPVILDRSLMRRMIVYSAPVVPTSVAAYLFDWMDIYFLRIFRATEEIGTYHVAYQSMWVVSELLAGVTTLAFPLLVRWRTEGSEERIRAYVHRLAPQAAVAWSLFVPAVGLASGLLFPLLFGPGFGEASRLFAMLLAGAAFQVILYFYNPLFASYDLLSRVTFIHLAMASINAVTDLLLVPSWGPMGAASATAASYAAGACLYLLLGNRRLGLRGGAAAVPCCLAALPLLAQAASLGVGLRVAFLIFSAALTVAWIKRRSVFRPEDVAMFDRVAMPRVLRAGIRRAYEVLA